MLNVKIEIKGDKETIAKLKKLGKSFHEWRPEMQKVGNYLVNFYQNAVFETEGGVFGMRWASLSAGYDFWKRKNYPGRGTLERTGRLRRGFSSDANQTSVIVENKVSYGRFHQYGTSRMKARPIMHIDKKLEDNIVDIFKEGLARKLASVL